MLLNITQCPGQYPQQSIIPPKMSILNNAEVEKAYSDMLFEVTKPVVIPNPLRTVSVIPRLIHTYIYIYNFATKIYAQTFEGTE